MATEPTEIRMARLEGAYEQINERLGMMEQHLVAEIGAAREEIGSVRTELRGEIGSVRVEVRGEIADLRKQITGQFYWLLTLILGSILIPFLRDLAR